MVWRRSEWLKTASPEQIEAYRVKERARVRRWELENPEKRKAQTKKQDRVKARARQARWDAKNKGYRSPGEWVKAAARREETKRKRAEKKVLAYQRRLARNKVWQAANREQYAAYKREWYQANAEKLSDQAKARAPATKARVRERRATDPQFAITGRLRVRMRKALFAQGAVRSKASAELIGCTPGQFREHIQAQFVHGMTWDNRSDWHLDHKLPCAAFDLTDPAQQAACFHYSNIRPVWGPENQRKGAKVLPEFLPSSGETMVGSYF